MASSSVMRGGKVKAQSAAAVGHTKRVGWGTGFGGRDLIEAAKSFRQILSPFFLKVFSRVSSFFGGFL
jgi:hypothetical protein